MGKPVVMGRKTFQSIGKALAGRLNVVVTRQREFAAHGVQVASDFDAALAIAASEGSGEIMVIGGGEIYAAAIGRADRLYITHVDASPAGDTHFPAIDPAEWKAGPAEQLPVGEKDTAATRFVTYERMRPKALG